MTINILSASAFDSGFGPITWRFQISSGDATLILTNPNALNVNINGVLVNINASVYANATAPPYGLLWGVFQSGGLWYVSVVPVGNSIYFGNINDWLNFDGPYVPLIPAAPHSIAITQYPQELMPVYNPVTFKFFSPLYAELGYRYLVKVKKDGLTDIGNFKLVPSPDGSGYIDLQSTLSNYVTYDFFTTNKLINGNQFNSYIKYTVEFGEEYVNKWNYTNVVGYTQSGLYNQYAVLNQANPSILHTYVVGDQITVDTVISGTTSTINGLYSVVGVPNNTQVVIDVPFPGASGSSIGVSGSTIYSDSRKIAYTGVTTSSTLYAFNGVMDWVDWKGYTASTYIVSGTGSTNDNDLLLTSMLPYGAGSSNDRYYMTDFQEAWFSFFVNNTNHVHRIVYSSNLDAEQVVLINDTTSKVRRFYFNFEYIMNLLSFNANLEYIEFYIRYDNIPKRLTKTYRIYRDTRCAINDIQVIFLDRMGSMLSIPFTLRTDENLNIERDKFKGAIIYPFNNLFDLRDRGESITNVKIDREYTLETNWMNDAQMGLYEELISSPYTFIDFGDGVYQSCIIQDGSIKLDRQKNKRIFRKTCKVKLANTQNINI